MTDRRIHALHEQASGLYLQGNYEDARAAWRQLLALDPQHGDALEGLMSCERLLAEDAPDTAPGGDAGVFGLDEDPFSDELEPAPLASADLVGPASDEGDSSFAGLDFDVADEEDEELFVTSSSDVPASPTESISDELRDSLDELDRSVAISAPSDEAVLEHTAHFGAEAPAVAVAPGALAGHAAPGQSGSGGMDGGETLNRRVNDLVGDALAAVERGAHEEALSILSRVLILDEENEAALSLMEKIRRDAEQQSTEAAAALPPDDGATEDIWADEADAAIGAAPPAAEERKPAAPPRTAPTSAPAPPAPPPADAAAARAALEPEPERPAARSPEAHDLAEAVRVAVARRRVALFGGLAVALVALAAWLLWGRLAGSAGETPPAPAAGTSPTAPASAPAEAAVASPGPAAGSAGASPVEGAAAAGERAAPAPGRAAHPDPAEVDALADRARRAFDDGDYGEAVVALHALLRSQPDNVEAQERLLLAGTRFREQRELAEQWRQALGAFEDGDYRNSLRILYRLPASEDQARIKRYITAGWYNIGVKALHDRDCRSAVESLGEAEALAPRDQEIKLALRLAHTCPRERATASFGLALDRFTLRKLPD